MDDDPENTAESGGRDAKGRFGPGNPGKPKGSRHKLGEAFIAALHDDFEANGVSTIQRVREERPQDYVKVVASLLPKEFKIETVSDLTDEQLDARLRQLVDVVQRIEGGAGLLAGGAEAQAGSPKTH